MKVKVTAIISFISAIGWVFIGLYIIATENINAIDEILWIISIMISSISTFLFVIWTKFGRNERSELEKIDYNNKILYKQIEQQELLKKLEK